MNTFNMHVKTIIRSEHGKILLLKQKRMDKKARWDLPGAPLTEDQSFDETVLTNIQKEIGYYTYPGKILGVTSYQKHDKKDLYVIMDSVILNGELLLSKKYDNYSWIDLNRITDYPLDPWLNNYIKTTNNPFNDVEIEIEDLNDKEERRHEFIQEDILSGYNPFHNDAHEPKKENNGNTLSMLKDTILRTFHPKEAKVTKTEPKNNLFSDEKSGHMNLNNKFNLKLHHNQSQNKETNDTENITIDHGDNENITVEHEEVVPVNTDDIVLDSDELFTDLEKSTRNTKNKTVKTKQVASTPKKNTNKKPEKKYFDMNVNRAQNMKNDVKVIREDAKVPHVRKEKENEEKLSFNSENINRRNWKQKLNDFNRTDANKRKKRVPHPKGKKR